MKIIISVIVLIHGLIHFMGFAKAFAIGNTAEFTKELSKPIGILWLLTGLLFILSTVMILLKKEGWPILAILATIVSQVLIFTAWTDAKYGTIANGIILIAAIIGFGMERFENSYVKDVQHHLQATQYTNELVTGKDLEHLPELVKKYLIYTGVVGKPRVGNFKIIFEGEMRDKGKDWFLFTSEQYNFIEDPTRLFFMKGKVSGIPTNGYHNYGKNKASMHIKVLSLFPVSKVDGPEMFQAETVTFFNDLCLFAPSSLIDKHIGWETIDEQSMKAIFTTKGTTISAILYFNEKGQLINFVSNDRYAVSGMKPIPFSTPVKDYKEVNGVRVPSYGETIWHYPDGEFVYGKFNLKSIEYNVTTLE